MSHAPKDTWGRCGAQRGAVSPAGHLSHGGAQRVTRGVETGAGAMTATLVEKYGENWTQPLLRPEVFQILRENGLFDPEGDIKRLEYSPEMCKGAFISQTGLR